MFPRRNSMVIDVKQSRSQYNLGHNPSLRYWQVMHIVDEANLLALNVVNPALKPILVIYHEAQAQHIELGDENLS